MVSRCSFGSVSRLGSLFVCGRSSLLGASVPRVSVAGARAIDQASSRWLEEMVDGLAPGTAVVSGLALGADTVAFRAALARGLPCVAVLPCGFDNITPRSNLGLARRIVEAGGVLGLARRIVEAGGVLVSEYPPSARATRGRFVARNQIIAELGKILIVPQFEVKSGTRHTVDFAQRANKLIVVQNADYSGNKFVLGSSRYRTVAK